MQQARRKMMSHEKIPYMQHVTDDLSCALREITIYKPASCGKSEIKDMGTFYILCQNEFIDNLAMPRKIQTADMKINRGDKFEVKA